MRRVWKGDEARMENMAAAAAATHVETDTITDTSTITTTMDVTDVLTPTRRRDALAAVATAIALARMLHGPPTSPFSINNTTGEGSGSVVERRRIRGGVTTIRFGEAAFAAVLVAILLVESVVRVAARGAAGVVELILGVGEWLGPPADE